MWHGHEDADRRRHVYLVEGDPVMRTRMVELLEGNGYAVTVVPTLDAAITQGFWNGDPARLLFIPRDPQVVLSPLDSPPLS